MNDLIKDEQGLVKTGQYTSVNPQFISQAGIQQAQSFANLPTTISSETLAGSPTPMRLTTPQPLTGADGLLGTVETGATAFATNQQQIAQQNQELATQKAKVETSKLSLMERLTGKKGEVALTEQEYAPTVDPLEKELKLINQQILEEQNALRKQLEGIQKVGILTDVQKEAQSRAIKRESASLQADLYIKQLGIQGQYDSARAIADRKIAVLLEQQKQELEISKFIYEENRDSFNAKEKQQMDLFLSDRERALNAQETKMKTFEDTRISLLKSLNENNAPPAVKMNVLAQTTTEGMINAAGEYGGDVLDRRSIKTLSGKPMTDAQSLSFGYGQRLNDANSIISDLGGKFTGAINVITGLSFFPNIWKSDERQQYEQAQRNFINAVLRKESGAAISPSEFDSAAKQYFPQPGDSQAVIDQKAANRTRVISNFAISANVPLETLTSQTNTNLINQVKNAGYDYNAIRADGYSDDEIKQALNLK